MPKQFSIKPKNGFTYNMPAVKGSKFIGIVFHISSKEEFDSHLFAIETRYPDASHYCYAYRIGNTIKSSDDHEPSGTAGKPILSAIYHSGYDNILIFVIRYFGGTMLGAGGLVRAYGGCSSQTLKLAPQEKIEIFQTLKCSCNYSDLPQIIGLVKYYDGSILSQKDGLLVAIELQINTGFVTDFMEQARGSFGIEVSQKSS